MDHDSEARRVFVEAILNRLRRHYVEQTPLPDSETETLTFETLRRLCEYVLAEGYGEYCV